MNKWKGIILMSDAHYSHIHLLLNSDDPTDWTDEQLDAHAQHWLSQQ